MALIVARANDGSGPVGTGGTGTPLQTTVTLDGTGGTEDTNVKTLYLYADGGMYYEDPTVSFTSEEAGIDYQISHNNSDWAENTYTFADMDALLGAQNTVFYVKAVVTNDGSGTQPATGTYTAAKMRLEATEYDHDPNL